jgi:hypothetical protein
MLILPILIIILMLASLSNRDWMGIAVENVDEDGPSVELLDGRLWRG